MTFLVVHQSSAEAIVIEYADKAAAEGAVEFLARTQGGKTTAYAAFALASIDRTASPRVEPQS